MAYSFSSMPISGFRGRPLANTFVRQEGGAQRLGILFPGVAYTADMPLLYYTRAVLLELGADVLSVESNYHRNAEYQKLGPEDRYRWVTEDAKAAADSALAQRDYRQVILAGKSLGTVAVASLAATDSRLSKASCIWLTPLVREAGQRAQIQQGGQRGLFVAGTADSLYDPAHWDELVQSVNGQGLLVPDADHSLEVPGDLMAGLRALERYVSVLQEFLGK
jgi:hypothetical protein